MRMEGKEQRFGDGAQRSSRLRRPARRRAPSTRCTRATAHWAVAPSWSTCVLGEVSPGGVGSGLYAIVIVALLAVFVAGLMVGRTPEYLGKTIARTRGDLRGPLHPGHAGARPRLCRDLPGQRRTALHDVGLRSARAHRGPLRLRVRGQQQRQRLRPVSPQTTPGTTDPCRLPCCSAASSPCCWCSPRGPARSRGGGGPRTPARCRPTDPSSSLWSPASSPWSPG